MLGIGAALGLSAFVGSYASYAINGGVGGYYLGAIALAVDQPMWVPIVGLPATFLILLFPDGHLPSPRWRWFAWVLGISMVITFLAILFGPGRFEESAFPNVVNPLGSEALRPVLAVATGSIIMLPIGVIASLVSLVQRFRRSTGIERLQLRWLVTAAGTVAILYASALILSFNSAWGTEATPGWLGVIQTLAIVSFGLIPIAIGISVLRYHLFDIDLVINRALLLAAMVVFITRVRGDRRGRRGPRRESIDPGPFRRRRRGRRPGVPAGAETCSALRRPPGLREASDALRGALAVLRPALERVRERGAVAEDGPGAGRGHGCVPRRRVGPRRRRAPSGGRGRMTPIDPNLSSPRRTPKEPTPSTMREPVRHRGELLGALSITKKPGESITATEEKLVRDLAAQAGLVMRNVALAEQLMDTIEELRASRQRLVTAQDERAKQLERNLHDGAQQQIVALTVKQRLLGQLMDRDVEKAKSMASDLQGDATDALEQLRDLARGIYPPLLADQARRRARGAGAQGIRPDRGAIRSDRPLPAGHRGGRLLLRARGPEQRGQVRRGDEGGGEPGADRRASPFRRRRRRDGFRHGGDELRNGGAGDGRPLGRDRRRPPGGLPKGEGTTIEGRIPRRRAPSQGSRMRFLGRVGPSRAGSPGSSE